MEDFADNLRKKLALEERCKVLDAHGSKTEQIGILVGVRTIVPAGLSTRLPGRKVGVVVPGSIKPRRN